MTSGELRGKFTRSLIFDTSIYEESTRFNIRTADERASEASMCTYSSTRLYLGAH